MKIALGVDHAGVQVKQALLQVLTKNGCDVVDFGTNSEESVDYPDFAELVAKAVSSGRCDRGILACGTGLGMAIAANKVKKIRAGSVWSVPVAKLAAEHNWCNVLCVPARFLSLEEIKKIVEAWLKTPFNQDGRHERRIKKILKIESKS